jgi:phenylpyruvate tautomerase PptA (4-oxalocrotonate tautomerase family)
MPTYTVTTTEGNVSDETKASVAAEITKIHSTVTGAPTAFVHVVFHELPATNVFSDSAPSHPLLITGLTRAGRADREKAQLAQDVSAASSRLTGIPEAHILVIIEDTPARFAVEGGRILPEPGTEDDWMNEAAP